MNKNRKGMTIIEMVLVLSLLVIVIAAAGAALVTGTTSFRINSNMAEDQHNARLLLVSITREIHKGVTNVECSNNSLTLTPVSKKIGGTPEDPATIEQIRYVLGADGELTRNNVPMGIKLTSFVTGVSDKDMRVTISLTGQNGLNLTTTVAIPRMPSTSGGSDESSSESSAY